MAIAFAILCLLIIAYILYLQRQLRDMNQQLTKRLLERTRQPLRIELINHELNRLTVNINKCFMEEERQRLESNRREKEIKELIANISHDLRTPLTAIRGYQQLMEKGLLSEDQKIKLKIAQKHADELSVLLERFFEYSCLISTEPQLQLERLNLTKLVIECLADSVNSFEERGLTVHIDEGPTLYVLADREALIRVIQNLIRNCIQHADGEVNVRLFITQTANVSFRNSVKNPSDIDIERIFDRYYTTKGRNAGTGLGLSIAKLLTEQMGGNVNAILQDDFIDIHVELPFYQTEF